MSANPPAPERRIKAICFDFMGTCLDWHSSITAALPTQLPEKERSAFALEWRQRYFDANATRLANGEMPEDVDVTHRRVLDELLATWPESSSTTPHVKQLCTSEVVKNMISAWHHQKAWPDVAPALQNLREQGYELFVHANSTTRLQLDLIKSSNLGSHLHSCSCFDMLFSSQMLSVYKPAPESYKKALSLIQRTPEECVMVAAHAYDLRGAKAVGMKTVYVYRWTDDVNEDQEAVKGECDAYLESGMEGLSNVIKKFG